MTQVYILNWEIINRIEKPISLLRQLMFWRPDPLPEWFYDVEFDVRFAGLLRPEDIVVTNDGLTLYINRVSGGHIFAQTVDFVLEENPSPTICTIKGTFQKEKI